MIPPSKTTAVIRLLTSCRCLLWRLTSKEVVVATEIDEPRFLSQEDKYSKYPDAPAAHSQSRRITVGTGFNSIHPHLFGSLRRLWDRPSHCLSSPYDQRDASKANERDPTIYRSRKLHLNPKSAVPIPNIWDTRYDAHSEVRNSSVPFEFYVLSTPIAIRKVMSTVWCYRELVARRKLDAVKSLREFVKIYNSKVQWETVTIVWLDHGSLGIVDWIGVWIKPDEDHCNDIGSVELEQEDTKSCE